VSLGAELIRGERRLVNGERGRLDRLQFSAQYSF
jgi:hypothetical protein